MKKQLKNHVPQLGMFLATIVALCVTSPAIAQPAKFTFKMDQHETILNDQATLEVLEAAIAQGLADPNDPAVAYELERAELQQMMSDYNSACTLITSALRLRAQPTLSIGNGLEFNNSDDLDPSTSEQNIIGFKIELGSTANLYDFGIYKPNNTPVLPMVVPDGISLTSSILDGGNTLSISFGNGGLEPGQMSSMKIQLAQQNAGPNTPWPSMTDFFSEDATLTVIFQNTTTMAVLETDPFPFVNFLDFSVALNQQIGTSQHLEGFVDSFEIDNNGGVVPEPSSVIIAMGSLGALLISRRRMI